MNGARPSRLRLIFGHITIITGLMSVKQICSSLAKKFFTESNEYRVYLLFTFRKFTMAVLNWIMKPDRIAKYAAGPIGPLAATIAHTTV